MSFSELLVVFFVGVFLIKPADIPTIYKKLREIFLYFNTVKNEILKELDKLAPDTKDDHDSREQINFYLQKIMELDEVYNGDYSLNDVRAFYHRLLIQKRIKS